MSRSVVITRPKEDACDYAEELVASGFDAIVEPMLAIQDVAVDYPDFSDFDAILLTSANAVRAFVQGCDAGWLELPVYCVGKHSAAAAREAGFKKAYSVDGTGVDLLAHVRGLNRFEQLNFLHICGRHVAFPMVDKINGSKGHARALVVYESKKVDQFSKTFVEQMRAGEVAAVTFFSKRTAEAFVSVAQEMFSEDDLESMFGRIKALSISEAVVECVRVLPWRDLHVSGAPDRAGMMKLLKAYV